MLASDLKKAQQLSKDVKNLFQGAKKALPTKEKTVTPYKFPYKALAKTSLTKDDVVALVKQHAPMPVTSTEVVKEIVTTVPFEVTEDLVKQIVQIMHRLPEADKLEVSKGIRNAQSFIFGKTKYDVSELMHGGSASSTAGAVVYYTPTGTVNAVNNVFGVTAQPTSVIADGTQYFAGAGYSYAANVITLDVPPSQYIRYTL